MNPSFAVYFAGDAYSTTQKIMGRQSAGKAFIKGIARNWPSSQIAALGHEQKSAQALQAQLRADGFAGSIRWSTLPDFTTARETGCLYYPAPPTIELAAARSLMGPQAFSLMGVTHTLSSASAMDQIAGMILPPYQPWDALICTSKAAHRMASNLHDEMRLYWHEAVGATRFIAPQLPVIPLGVNCNELAATDPASRAKARSSLSLESQEVAFLFAGRLSFHAKANPAPVYQALQAAAQQRPVVCVEAGVFPNDAIRKSFEAAQRALAPSVRFIAVDGKDEAAYRQAWQAADVFVSLSDNIQETFGLTPVEAMAAGLPVIVSDWDGYKDTVRDGIDGFRVPTVVPPPGGGGDLAVRHALGVDTYDFYIGRASLATVVSPDHLRQAVMRLAEDSALRQQMGAAGRVRALAEFDWPVILRRYDELARELSAVRSAQTAAPPANPTPWPQRADPFHRFAHFASTQLSAAWRIKPHADLRRRLAVMGELSVANYGFDPLVLPKETLTAICDVLEESGDIAIGELLGQLQLGQALGYRAVLWLWKFDLIGLQPQA